MCNTTLSKYIDVTGGEKIGTRNQGLSLTGRTQHFIFLVQSNHSKRHFHRTTTSVEWLMSLFPPRQL